MKAKNSIITVIITLILSFLLQGISDQNVFKFSNWRLNNVLNILHLWFTFLTSYYLFSFIVEKGCKRFLIDTSKKFISLLLITQTITFTWVILMVLLYYKFYYKVTSLSETTFYEFDVPLAIVILTIGSVYFYQKNYLQPINNNTQNNQNLPEQKLEVFKGSKSIFLNHSDIATIHLYHKIVWITTIKNEIFQTNLTITELINMLSPSNFYRLNRQVIVARKIIKGYNKIEYQKLEVLISNNIHSEINLVVSKYNASNFKKWVTNSS